MVFIVSALLFGILSARQNIELYLILPGIILFYILLTVLCLFKKISFNRYDLFLFFLPVIFLAGFFRMKEQLYACNTETCFEKSKDIVLQGVVQRIQKAQERVTLYVDKIEFITDTGISCCGEIVIFTDNQADVMVGNLVQVTGKITSFSHASNPGQFDEYNYYKANDICAKMSAKEISIINYDINYINYSLMNIKEKLLETFFNIFPEREAGIIAAMILGEKSYTDSEIKTLYQENGISHILAISGLHLSLIGLGIFNILRKVRGSILQSIIFSFVLILLYAYMTGFSVSAKRAVIMFLISLSAKLIGCTYDILSSLSFSALIVLFGQPMMLFQAGFLLSFGAVAAIAVIYPTLGKLVTKERFKKAFSLIQSLLISLSVQLLTVPIIIYFYFSVPVYGVFLNLIVIPLMTFVVSGSIFAGIMGCFFLPLGKFIGGGVYYILKLYEFLCVKFESIPNNITVIGRSEISQIVIYYSLIAFIFIIYKIINKKIVLIFLLLIFFILKREMPEGIEAVFLDVGQGDCIYIKNKYGTSFLFDGGSSDVSKVGTYRIRPFLLSYGVDKVDYVFVSHVDADHISGIRELIELNMVCNIVMTDISDKPSAYLELENLALSYGVKVLYFCEGSSLIENDFNIYCYYPKLQMSGLNTNESSMILEVEYKELSIMLTGDAGAAAEYNSIRFRSEKINKDSRVTILKAAHHGSNYSSSDVFLNQIMPLYSIISCSKYNSYGHPGLEAIKRLEAVNSNIYITYETGAVMLKSDGYNLILRTMY